MFTFTVLVGKTQNGVAPWPVAVSIGCHGGWNMEGPQVGSMHHRFPLTRVVCCKGDSAEPLFMVVCTHVYGYHVATMRSRNVEGTAFIFNIMFS